MQGAALSILGRNIMRLRYVIPATVVSFAAGWSGLLIWITTATAQQSAPAPAATGFSQVQIDFFERQVRPVLEANCFKCHGGQKKIKGGLRLTSRSGVLGGGDSGPAVSLDNPAASLLLEAIRYENPDYKMPPGGKLPQADIDTLARWIRTGLPWTPADQEPEPEPTPQLEPPVDEFARSFWSFQRLQRPPLPQVGCGDPVRNAIDTFILARWKRAGLEPSPPASRGTLLRRAYYDLIGLPPSPQQVDTFVADRSDNAFEKVVDRLLASRHYGEKWARHWLDLVRYAETNSYERDGAKPHVWRYRDYVIRSLNEDKPYDQFVREQLAGDEMDQVTPDSIIATGYYRLGVWQDEPVDREQELYEDLDDIVRTTSEVLLGITIGCARCHDHKLDPLPQRDYYRFLAFFRNVRRYGIRTVATVEAASVRNIELSVDAELQQSQFAYDERLLKEIRREIALLETPVKEKLAAGEKDDFEFESNRLNILKKYVGKGISQAQVNRYETLLQTRQKLLDGSGARGIRVLCVTEHGPAAPPTHVLIRGNAHSPGELVEPGFASVLNFPDPTIPPAAEDATTSGRRRVLADWITNTENPLTARVIANRLWQYHFGRGIVRSPNNFGFQGDAPTHPRLLDYLASELVAGGWTLKAIHRRIMLSAAYRISSRASPRGLAKDPENDLFWRFDMRRLTAEEIRDSILAVNASLNPTMCGPSMYPLISDEVKAGQSLPGSGWGESTPGERARRSIYVHTKRSLIVPMIAAFDAADADATCPVRFTTVQPTQALGMINGEFLNRQAGIFAAYLREQAGNETQDQVTLALQRTLQRNPNESEVQRGIELLDSLQRQHHVDAQTALTYYCLVVLNLNEFLYLD